MTRVLAFGTYRTTSHPRIGVLVEGLRSHGVQVDELNAPLNLSTSERVRMLRQPWRLPLLAARLVGLWVTLAWGTRRYRGARRPHAVLVGYMGHFDVLLARVLFPQTTLILDHLIFAADTARDRGSRSPATLRVLELLDGTALRAADVVVLDTAEHADMLPPRQQYKGVVVPVGAPEEWFAPSSPTVVGTPARIVFFGLFTPLQGAPTIGRALSILEDRNVSAHTHLVGDGQDAEEVHSLVDTLRDVEWTPWLEPAALQKLVRSSDVCIGVVGTSAKAQRVIPNKVYQGAAAGCAVVTSETPPQRRLLGDAAVLVRAGDPEALADALEALLQDPDRLLATKQACYRLATQEFTPAAVVTPLLKHLGGDAT